MYKKKKRIALAHGLFCMALLVLQTPEALAARVQKKPSKRVNQVRPVSVSLNKRGPPPELWSRLRTRLRLPKPAPVHLPPELLERLALLQAASSDAAMVPTGLSTSANLGDDELDVRRTVPVATAQAVADSASGRLSVPHTPASSDFPAAMTGNASSGNPSQIASEADEHPIPAIDDGLTEEVLELKRREAAYARYREQVQWFSRRMGFIRQSINRGLPYLYLILEDLEAHKLPLDLALLPILESGYEPRAVSPKLASGIWQFMAGTGREYGLIKTDWYDGRLDIVTSTRAAGRFLAHLSRKFQGDWLLALAAYNCGEKRVEQAIAANRAAGQPTDFWSLKLPAETMAYVPRLLALSTIFSNPKAYGLALQPQPYRPTLVKIRFEHRMPVDEVSRLAGMSVEEFTHLNPGFIQNTVAVDAPSELLLPEYKRAEFQGRLEVASLKETASEPLLLAKNDQIPFCAANPFLE